MAEQRFIITIGRQFGSGGLDIAQRLAKRLGVWGYILTILLGFLTEDLLALMVELYMKKCCVIAI